MIVWTFWVQNGFVMKHLLQDRFTRRYFVKGNWTSDITKAEAFPNTLSAVYCCIENNIRNVVLILVLGTEPSTDDVRMPLFADEEEHLLADGR